MPSGTVKHGWLAGGPALFPHCMRPCAIPCTPGPALMSACASTPELDASPASQMTTSATAHAARPALQVCAGGQLGAGAARLAGADRRHPRRWSRFSTSRSRFLPLHAAHRQDDGCALHGRRAPVRCLDDEDALRERSHSQLLLALVMVAWSLWCVFES